MLSRQIMKGTRLLQYQRFALPILGSHTRSQRNFSSPVVALNTQTFSTQNQPPSSATAALNILKEKLDGEVIEHAGERA
jgi:hypothetical protein